MLFFLLLRWQSFRAPLIRDEGEYAYAAQLLKSGELPYEHSFLQKPPMIAYTYALAELIAPDVCWFPRVLAGISLAACTFMLGYVIKQEFGWSCVFPSLWLFTPMVLMPKLDQTVANTESFMLLPIMGVLCMYERDRFRRYGVLGWFAAGACSAFAILYKYTALPLLAMIWLLWLREKWKAGLTLDRLAGLVCCSLAGLCLTGLLVLAPFLIADGGSHLWECTIVFNRAYGTSSTFSLDSFYRRMSTFWEYWRLLFLIPLLLLLREPPRLRLWLWLTLGAWISTGGSCYTQYYLPVMPFWAGLCGVALANFAALITRGKTWAEVCLRRSFSVAAVVLLCLCDLPLLIPNAREAAKIDHSNPFPESRLMASRLAECTRPDEQVYIAGSEPQILAYAHRKSCTRFIIAYPMMIPTGLAEKYQAEAIRDLKCQRPNFVIFATSNSSWLEQEGTPRTFQKFLAQLLNRDYEQVAACVPARPEGPWIEPVSRENSRDASLVLYRRKSGAPETPAVVQRQKIEKGG